MMKPNPRIESDRSGLSGDSERGVHTGPGYPAHVLTADNINLPTDIRTQAVHGKP
jgi:hypothetical protein